MKVNSCELNIVRKMSITIELESEQEIDDFKAILSLASYHINSLYHYAINTRSNDKSPSVIRMGDLLENIRKSVYIK